MNAASKGGSRHRNVMLTLPTNTRNVPGGVLVLLPAARSTARRSGSNQLSSRARMRAMVRSTATYGGELGSHEQPGQSVGQTRKRARPFTCASADSVHRFVHAPDAPNGPHAP